MNSDVVIDSGANISLRAGLCHFGGIRGACRAEVPRLRDEGGSCPIFLGTDSAAPSINPFIHSRVMKQILLGIAAMLSKVLLCERSQPRCVQFSRARKVVFAQDPLDPDIDGEGAQTFVSEKHHTISNLRAYAR